ncbi:MAG: hypothetical protein AAGJ38_00925 [Planctomycetota bacterium]
MSKPLRNTPRVFTSGDGRLYVKGGPPKDLAPGSMAHYNFESGELLISTASYPQARPRIAAEAVMCGWLSSAPFPGDKQVLARYLAAPMLIFAEELVGTGGGSLAFALVEDTEQQDHPGVAGVIRAE